MSDPDFFPELDRITTPMSPRGWATIIMTRLTEGGLDLLSEDANGYTVQDIITVCIERAIQDAMRPLQPAEPARQCTIEETRGGYGVKPPEPIRDDGKLA